MDMRVSLKVGVFHCIDLEFFCFYLTSPFHTFYGVYTLSPFMYRLIYEIYMCG